MGLEVPIGKVGSILGGTTEASQAIWVVTTWLARGVPAFCSQKICKMRREVSL
ncbi:hypothetical protein CA13_24460 [Planctomycetes bacterium CA13]|uniref:Uncharacterized protein n=1 Tax=Novipirellula herctigrandis TaxID=2527986 RepID=A0A5C5Z128_9BACT|nr:hypothetical protein CA13_24460 [Planctomycetes bacterium CA13]